MSHGVKNFHWRNGRPRWIPSPRLRREGAKGKDLLNAAGAWLPLYEAMVAAHAINRYWGVAEPAPQPPAEQREPLAEGAGFVYFLLVGTAVKIGFSRSPLGRVSDIQANNPSALTMLVVVPGTMRDERAIHDALAADRMQGEWFHASARAINVMLRSVKLQRAVSGTTNLRNIP